MSVYKSRRKDAAVEFISQARNLRFETMRIVKKFPTSYRWIITNSLLELSKNIYVNALRANSIYVHKDMSEQDYELRHRYLTMAIADTDALTAEISFCYSLIDDGNNFFKDKRDYSEIFSRWLHTGNTTLAKLRGVRESDAKRWKSYHAQQ